MPVPALTPDTLWEDNHSSHGLSIFFGEIAIFSDETSLRASIGGVSPAKFEEASANHPNVAKIESFAQIIAVRLFRKSSGRS
jgi:hypothetical protein